LKYLNTMGKSETPATRRRSSTSRPGTLKKQAAKKFSDAELKTSQKSVSGSRSSSQKSEKSVDGGDLVSRRPSAPALATVGHQRGRKFTATELVSVEEDPDEGVSSLAAPPSVLQSVFKFTTGLFHGQDTKR